MAATRDVVVVGSGHNALVAACYLARDGLDVEVVEKDTVVGGAVSTVERWPGYHVDRGSSAHIMVRHTGIVEDLRLDECGLTYLDMDPWGFAPFGDPATGEQRAITFHVDLDRTCTSIAAVCGERDAEAYRAFVTDWADRNERVFAAFQDVPSPGRLGRHLWGVGKAAGKDGLELSRQFLQPGDQLLDEHFTDERLKTALAWLGAQSGPPTHEVATADLVGWNALHAPHAARPRRRRLGALTAALAERLTRMGGSVRARRRRRAHHPRRRPGHRRRHRQRRPRPRPRRRRGLPRPHHPRAARRRGPARPRDRAVRVGNGIGMVVRLGTNALPRYPERRRPDVRRARLDAAARAEPHAPTVGVRRVRRGSHADAAGRPRDDAERPSTRASPRRASTT